MSKTINVPSENIVRMLERSAKAVGLSLRDFYEQGKADTLGDPELRDLWLIWRHELRPEDLQKDLHE